MMKISVHCLLLLAFFQYVGALKGRRSPRQLDSPSHRSNILFDDPSFTPSRFHDLNYGDNHPMDQKVSRKRKLNDEDETNFVEIVYDEDNNDFQPIRIKVIADVIDSRRGESSAQDEFIEAVLQIYMPAAIRQWAQHLLVAPVQGSIDIQHNECYGIYQNKLSNQSTNETDLVVLVSMEDFLDFGDGSIEEVCYDQGPLAIAAACSLDQYDRPVVGFINWCNPDKFSTSSSSVTEALQQAVRPYLGLDLEQLQVDSRSVAIHELGHILGFANWLFKYYREADGSPWTSRPFETKTIQCADGSFQEGQFPSSNTLTSILTHDGSISFVVSTPRVRSVVRNHLGCQSLLGASLGADGSCFGSHWAERYFLGEIMSPALSASSENVLSALSLALMEDSGWYKVDYQGVGTPIFGLHAGCGFATQPCIVDDTVPLYGQGLFCDAPIRFDENNELANDSISSIGCDPGHRSWTMCDLWDETNFPASMSGDIPASSKRYFSDQNLVSILKLTDFCPLPIRSLGVDCTDLNSPYSTFYRGEEFGTGSRCVDAVRKSRTMDLVRPACLPLRCDDVLQKVVITISDDEYVCDEDDQKIISALDISIEYTCPRLSAVCPEYVACPGSCSGRGICVDSVCECDEDAPKNEGCFPLASSQNSDSVVDSGKPSNATKNGESGDPTSHPDTHTTEENMESSAISTFTWGKLQLFSMLLVLLL